MRELISINSFGTLTEIELTFGKVYCITGETIRLYYYCGVGVKRIVPMYRGYGVIGGERDVTEFATILLTELKHIVTERNEIMNVIDC